MRRRRQITSGRKPHPSHPTPTPGCELQGLLAPPSSSTYAAHALPPSAALAASASVVSSVVSAFRPPKGNGRICRSSSCHRRGSFRNRLQHERHSHRNDGRPQRSPFRGALQPLFNSLRSLCCALVRLGVWLRRPSPRGSRTRAEQATLGQGRCRCLPLTLPFACGDTDKQAASTHGG